MEMQQQKKTLFEIVKVKQKREQYFLTFIVKQLPKLVTVNKTLQKRPTTVLNFPSTHRVCQRLWAFEVFFEGVSILTTIKASNSWGVAVLMGGLNELN